MLTSVATTLQRLATIELGADVVEWAAARRPESWQKIANELREATGIIVTDETLRLWCLQEGDAA